MNPPAGSDAATANDPPGGIASDGSPPSNGAGSQPDQDDPIATLRRDFAAFQTKVDGKLGQVGQDLGRIRSRIKDPVSGSDGQQGNGQDKEKQTGTMDRSEGIAMMNLGRLQASLPQDAQKEIDQMLTDGASWVETSKYARAIKRGMELAATAGNDGGTKNPPAPPGKAASAPGATPPAEHPKTERDYLRLVKRANGGDAQAKKRKDALHNDPNFHPEDLPKK